MTRFVLGFLLLAACGSSQPASESERVPPPNEPATSEPTRDDEVPTESEQTASEAPAPVEAANAARDPDEDMPRMTIDSLVAELSANPLWTNGISPGLDSPPEATSETILDEMFTRISFDEGPVTDYRITEQREVLISPETEPYRALELETDQGRKLVLLRYVRDSQPRWWSRVFNVTP